MFAKYRIIQIIGLLTLFIQFGCSIQWNLCLPLLQPGLRKDVRKPLEYVAECLENIER